MQEKQESEKAGLRLNIQKTKIIASGPIISWQIDGKIMETVIDFCFRRLQNHGRWWMKLWNLMTLISWKKSCDKPRLHVKEQRHSFANKGPYSEIYVFVFFSSLVPMQVIP